MRLKNPPLGLTDNTHFPLTPGSAYVVYAVTLLLGDVWYYICDDDYSYFPVWYPATLFRVEDPRLSKTWQYAYDGTMESSDEAMLLAFRECAQDRRFYERLTNHDPDAVEVFRKYKEAIDSESAERF